MSLQSYSSTDDSRSFYRCRLLRSVLISTTISLIGIFICIAIFIWNNSRTHDINQQFNWSFFLSYILGGFFMGVLGGVSSFLLVRLKERQGSIWAGALAVAIGVVILFSPFGFSCLLDIIDPKPDYLYGYISLRVAVDTANPYGQFVLAGIISLIWGLMTLCIRSKHPAPIAPPS